MPSPEEEDGPGADYTRNAILKAIEASRTSGLPALADDSGLEVDALDGRPGVMSARYGGADITDRQRIDLLLSELQGVPDERRTARFRCVVAIALPTGEVHTSEGVLEGRIANAPRGESGFGYDPVFLLPDRGLTLAEVSPEVKNTISHRARAVRAAADLLRRLANE